MRMTKHHYAPPKWRPALAGPQSYVFKKFTIPFVVGGAGPIATNLIFNKMAEVPLAINLVGSALLLIFVKNKAWGAGALATTISSYLYRKFASHWSYYS